MTHRLPFLASSVLLSFALAACGGSIASIPEPDDNGSGNGGDNGGGSGNGSSGGAVCMAYPSCDPGDREVKSCVPDSYCYTRSMCGSQIICTGDVQCAGYPSCPSNMFEVSECATDVPCTKVTMCGATISCQGSPAGCLAPKPICDQGDTEIAGPSACLQDDARCYSRSSCNGTIWCTGPLPDAGK